jgi:predicted metal-dependent hydrolase
MANKTAEIDGIGTVNLYKRKGSRHIRLSISANGQIRVTMPHWVPYSAGVTFAKQKSDWLKKQVKPPVILLSDSQIGKKHRLLFENTEQAKVTSRLYQDGRIVIRLPREIKSDASEAQSSATKACIRALKREAEDELPSRLKALADHYGFSYRSVEVKQLKGRWGSCDQRQQIVLNCYLMQLPWELIDYVFLHELVHTKIMAHGPRFWQEMAKYVKNLPAIRKLMRQHRPTVTVLSEQESLAS